MMKIKLLLSAFLFCYVIVNAQNVWIEKATFPGTERATNVSFSIGDKAYVGLGKKEFVPPYFFDFWEYNSLTDTWTKKADFPSKLLTAYLAFSIGDKGYILNQSGSYTNIKENEFWEYDPVKDSWTRKANLPGPYRVGGVAFSTETKGYYGLGKDDDTWLYIRDFWEYEPSSDKWTRKADFPGIARTGATSFSLRNKGYVGLGTGKTWTGYLSDFWEYDPDVNKWIQKMGMWDREYAYSFVINNRAYVGGGQNVNNGGLYKPIDDLWEYNPFKNSWTRKASLKSGRIYGVSFSIGNSGYVGLGYAFKDLKDLWQYTPDSTSFDEEKVYIFPNPSSGIFNVRSYEGNIKKISISNSIGGNVFEQELNSIEITVDLTYRTKGIYFIMIQTENEIIREKVLLN